jgi:hypothetical protein
MLSHIKVGVISCRVGENNCKRIKKNEIEK